MQRVVAVFVLFICACVAAGCGGSRPANEAVRVTPSGRIGPLRTGQSTRQQVISFAGRPSAETRGRYASYAPFDALGYDCTGHVATNKAGLPACTTVYYLDTRTGRLVLLFTRDPRYVYRGVHPGTLAGAAERRLSMRPGIGCYTGFAIGTGSRRGAGTLVMEVFRHAFTKYPGGYAPRTAKALRNSHVGFLALQTSQSRQANPGVLDCIDS